MHRLGIFSLILALICLLVTLGLKFAMSGWMPFMSFGLGFAAFFFLFAILTNLGSLKSAVRSESLHFLLKSSLVVITTFVLLFALNYLVLKAQWYKDLTTNKLHSLHPLTQSLLKALPEKAEFFYFHVDNQHVRGFERIVRDEVARYQQISPKIKFQSHSVFKRPDLAKKFKVGDEQSTLYLRYKGRIQRVNDLTEVDFLNAFLKLTRESKKIYFVASHGTRQLEDESTFGLSVVREQLERLHYEVDELDNLNQPLPENIAILALVGPRQKLSESESQVLEAYMENGGTLFLALDPGETHGFDGFLEKFSLKFMNTFVFEDQPHAGQSPLLTLVHRGQGEHPVARSLEEGQTPFFFMASAIEILEPPAETQVKPLLEFLPSAKAHKDVEPDSPVVGKGRQVAAAMSEGQSSQGEFYRLALVGDSDFMTNQFSQQPATFDFIINLFSYLAKDEDLLKMRPTLPEATPLTLTQSQMNLYFLFFVLPYGVLFLIIALFFKLRRYF